jgi:GNAT superfamily N-acetyltransferase
MHSSRAASPPERLPSIALTRPAEPGDEQRWRTLWAAYCDFYGAAVSEEVTAATWRRILDPEAPIEAVVAVVGGQVEGFANVVLHEFTWSERPTCLLEDLFVAPSLRGRGVGKQLIDHVLERARAAGWARVYWHTRADNAEARRLYDTITPADGFVRYTVVLHGAASSPPA